MLSLYYAECHMCFKNQYHAAPLFLVVRQRILVVTTVRQGFWLWDRDSGCVYCETGVLVVRQRFWLCLLWDRGSGCETGVLVVTTVRQVFWLWDRGSGCDYYEAGVLVVRQVFWLRQRVLVVRQGFWLWDGSSGHKTVVLVLRQENFLIVRQSSG